MAEPDKRMWLTRRSTLIGAGVLAVGGLWGGTTLARLARDPSGPKSCGRIADIDGIGLPLEAPNNLPPHDPNLPWLSKGGDINDASCLSVTPVYGIVEVTTEDHIARALGFAREHGLKVSMAAVRHSMGGHAFDDHALVLDMRKFNKIELDAKARTVTVQPGASWHDIQNVLHPKFAVKAMQSSDIFSVGGSISVNAHGMDHHAGAVAGTIRHMTVMRADGSIVPVSREVNADLFYHIVGGYGLFGVVLSATIDITENEVYQTSRQIIAADEFSSFFEEKLKNDNGLGLFYGHLSTAPGSFMEEMIVYRYDRTELPVPDDLAALGEPGAIKIKRLLLNLSKYGSLFKSLKWYAEKSLEPKVESCIVPRTAAMSEGEACLVSRNDPMHDSVPYLFNDLKGDTDILHEYFVPRDRFMEFVAEARKILKGSELAVLNASVRIVHGDDIALTYAPADAFSLVLYINQGTDENGNEKMRAVTRKLIDLAIEHDGRFFLPYQLHYTGKQLLASYPEIEAFLAKKREVDPDELFTSTWYRAVSGLVGVG